MTQPPPVPGPGEVPPAPNQPVAAEAPTPAPPAPVPDDPWAGDGPPAAPDVALPEVPDPAPQPKPEPEAQTEPEREPEPQPEPQPEPSALPQPAPAGRSHAEPPPEPAVIVDPELAGRPDPELTALAGADEGDPAWVAPPPRPAQARGLPWPVVALAGALAVLVALVAVLALSVRRHSQTDDARRQALAAATSAAAVLLAYDYRHLSADFARGKALTTGAFRRDYESTTARVVGPPALAYRAVVTAQVAIAGVVAAGPHSVVVLLFVNQVTTSTRVTGQKLDQNRVRMTMQDSGGRWLVSKVEAL